MAKHPDATDAESLAYNLLVLRHPCEGADPTRKVTLSLTHTLPSLTHTALSLTHTHSPLSHTHSSHPHTPLIHTHTPHSPTHTGQAHSRALQRKARKRSPRAVVSGYDSSGFGDDEEEEDDDKVRSDNKDILQPNSPRFMASHRYALHWIYSICGVGPFYMGRGQRGGLGWDALLATLACLLGHQTIILTASPNDNGLLHQEFVDFELPSHLGWSSSTTTTTSRRGGSDKHKSAATNDAERCSHSALLRRISAQDLPYRVPSRSCSNTFSRAESLAFRSICPLPPQQ